MNWPIGSGVDFKGVYDRENRQILAFKEFHRGQDRISAIACHFGVPMIVTDVGGLKNTIGARGTGIVASEASPAAIRKEILRFFGDSGLQESCRQAIAREKDRLSWDRFCQGLAQFADTLKKD